MAIHFSAPIEAGATDYSGRITLFVVLSCVTAAMGGVIFGYDIGVSGGVTSMEAFLEKFFPALYARMRGDTRVSNYCKFDSQLLTAFTSSLYVAGLFATFAAAPVTQSLGRRPTMLVGGVSFFAGAALGGGATSIYMVIFGRVLLGIGLGLTNQAVPLYLSEMAPPRFRGAFNNSFQFSIGVGALSASLVNYGTEKIPGGWGWRVSLALAAVPAFLLSLGALFLPETPNSLLQQGGDPLAAKRVLQQIRGAADVDAEFDDLVAAADASRGIRRPFCQILHREHRPHLVMAVAIPFFQQVTGINVIAFYVPVLIRTIGLGEGAALLSAVMTSVVGSASTLISMFVVDRVGRRALFLAGGIQMLVTQVMIGGILARQLGDEGGVNRVYAYLLLVLIAVYVAGFGWSWGPLGWLVPSEIFPLEIRTAGQSITVAVNFLFTFVVAQTFLAMLCRMRSGIFFFFAGWLVAMTAFVYWMLPETRNIPMEQMGKVWREHWFWKKVVGESLGADPKMNDLSRQIVN